jgi:hypothetical protein
LFVECNSSDQKKDIKTVTEFPVKKEIKATVIRTAPVILAPSGIFIMNDRIWVIQIQKDTLFDVFDLYNCSYLYGTGTKGPGPDEFIFPMVQTIQVDGDEFTIFDNIMLKTVEMSPNGHIHIKKSEKIFNSFPVNGFMKLNDSLFCAFADCATGMAGDFEFEFKLKNIRSGEETKFGKYPDLTTQKYQGDQKCQIYHKYPIANSSQGRFATFYSFFKIFRIYSINGEPEKEIHVNIAPYSFANSWAFSTKLRVFSPIFAIVRLSAGVSGVA